MQWIIFGSLYQAKEGLYFYAHSFTEELSIYVARQSGVAFPLYKQHFGGEKDRGCLRCSLERGSTRLNPTSRGRIRLTSEAESYSWLHSPFHRLDMQKGPFKDP